MTADYPVDDRVRLHSPLHAGEAVDISSADHTCSVQTRALWIGGAGAVKVTTLAGDDLTLSGVANGTLIPIRATKVFKTGTTATLILALW